MSEDWRLARRLYVVLLCASTGWFSACSSPAVLGTDAGFDAALDTQAQDATSTSDASTGDASTDASDPHLGWTTIVDERLTQLQTAVAQGREEHSLPGLAMAAAYADSQELMVAVTGLSNVTEGEDWNPAQSFRIGSVTKTFTAAIILQLVEEGTLTLNDSLERWVPAYYAGVGVTVRHLITNTSGIVSYNYVGSFDAGRSWSPTELVEWAVTHEPELRFEPGSDWEYSNTNYVLLGLVIEAATGSTYDAALHARLLDPLGLSDTYLAQSVEPNEHIVRAYDAEDNDISSLHDPSLGWAAGGMVSTPCDLARWGASLYAGDVLSAPMLELLLTPGVHNSEYGHGSFVEVDGAQALYGHTGGIGGYGTYMYHWRNDNITLVVMRNKIDREASFRDLAGRAWLPLLGMH
ncbi:MAG: serine hydrolase domain-containing protein [Polyangiales bacterium]